MKILFVGLSAVMAVEGLVMSHAVAQVQTGVQQRARPPMARDRMSDRGERYESEAQKKERVLRLVSEGVEAAEDYQFPLAQYKFEAALLRVEGLETSTAQRRASDALRLMIQKSADPYLRASQKLSLILEGSKVVDEALSGYSYDEPLSHAEASFLLDQMERVVQLVEDYEEVEAVISLRSMIKVLSDHSYDADLNQALRIAESLRDTLRDRYLSNSEKRRITIRESIDFADAIRRSRTDFEDEYPNTPEDDYETIRVNDLREALEKVSQLTDLVRDGKIRKAEQTVNRVESFLERYYKDPEIQKALRALKVMAEKLSDRRLGHRELIEVVRDCSRIFKEAIERPLPYRRLEGINYDSFKQMSFGKTELSSKSKYETRITQLLTPFQFQAVRVRAKDDSIILGLVEVEYVNGSRDEFRNIQLGENQSTYLELSNINEKIKTIKVTAISSNTFGTKGRVELSGILLD